MKKLIIALFATAMAVATQAASVDWTLSVKNSVTLKDGSAASGIAVYLFDTGAADYAATIAGLTDGSITADTIASASGYLGTANTGTGKSAGKIAQTATSHASIVGGEMYDLAFIIFDSNVDGDFFYTSNTQAASGWDGVDTLEGLATVASWDSATYSAGTWTAVQSVPEPTSGLLLLLGMAGLALKRKQA